MEIVQETKEPSETLRSLLFGIFNQDYVNNRVNKSLENPNGRQVPARRSGITRLASGKGINFSNYSS
jgi:hypothetical protein